jgi:hypothetical protein
MTLIQGKQIDLITISGYIEEVAMSSSVADAYYPMGSNPSGYIIPSQTGQFQPAGTYLSSSETGNLYPSYNPSGFITGLPTGNLTNSFYPLHSNPSGYLNNTSGLVPSGSPLFYPFGNLPLTDISGFIYLNSNPPASTSAAGISGQLTFDSGNMYICVAPNSWGKVALNFSF